uniref:BAHD acyltransferase-like 02 n=1 Tax=Taxus x media TaxID=85957 RepID=A0A515L541_9CONI|nr:BAHD acyltransferase-like 02 [Taxus x media]
MAALHEQFTVQRRAGELVRPASETPQGVLFLSNLDDRTGVRLHASQIQFYQCNKTRKEDPAKVIKEALGKVLDHFYPLAGRLRPSPRSPSKLLLHCTGEGVSFVEADADVSLRHFFKDNNMLIPPFHCVEKLFDDTFVSTSIIDSPLISIQVTRLSCGGFAFAMRFNHCVSDGYGMYLFVRALSEMAKGAHVPSIPPVWERERLLPRKKPLVQFLEYDYKQDCPGPAMAVIDWDEEDETVRKSIVFSSKEIALLKREAGLTECSTFDVLSAYLWRVRTRALNIPDNEVVRLIIPVDFRSRLQPPLPQGYCGNAIILAYTDTTAADLINNGLSFATKLVHDAKAKVNEEYVRSVIDLIELRPVPSPPGVKRGIGLLVISNISRIGYHEIDFGWGKAVYGGDSMHTLPRTMSPFISVVDRNSGKVEIAAALCLPASAMQVIEAEIVKLKMSSNTPAVFRSSL